MSPAGIRERLVRVARRLDERGILSATDGNLSLRLAGGGFLVTPSGCCKGWLREDELVEVAADGSCAAGQPSTELGMHLAIYRTRPDVEAVVHAHPPEATARAVQGLALEEAFLSEAVLTIGSVPVVEWSMPGEARLGELVGRAAREHDAMLLRFHGAVTLGRTIEEAGFRMETLEHVSLVDRLRRMAGGGSERLPDGDAALLEARRRRS